MSVKKAIANGLKVMEKYFDKVELSISDSEGDENDQRLLHFIRLAT